MALTSSMHYNINMNERVGVKPKKSASAKFASVR
jgi:hypothetical protein